MESLTTHQLIKHCQIEQAKERPKANEAYCLELFRRALVEQDEVAWEGIYQIFRPLVLGWVHRYPIQGGEDADFFVNGTFERFWRSLAKSDQSFTFKTIGQCLLFLKGCVRSAIIDQQRSLQKDALYASVELLGYDIRILLDLQTTVDTQILLHDIITLLLEEIAGSNKRKRIVIEESFINGLFPQQIWKRHSAEFTNADEISQIKKKILKKFKNHPKFKVIRQEWTEK